MLEIRRIPIEFMKAPMLDLQMFGLCMFLRLRKVQRLGGATGHFIF